ncbi:GNAT family N-acetyltransferase [Gordonibacter sp. An230]|uniref:GNAT family N-acetyltransferase n=1 Tax=Gordonibacter sp. An230 TaxID=1965592 RepID=UPI000B38B626|nr:GNAT family N-acetyltransferase [Gordonibacter sp. An230]OUO90766.1 GNAT family N-acetyltransferase [Gordonibacter sp. An230]
MAGAKGRDAEAGEEDGVASDVAEAALRSEGAAGGHVARGIACAALGGICWGFSGTCAQLMTGGFGVPVPWITCVRLLSAAVVFLAVCAVREPRNLLAALRDARSLARIAAFALFGVLLTQVSYLTAISYTNAGTGTVLERLGLVLIMLYVCLRARRLPRAREAVGLVLAIAGTVLIATKGNFGELAIPAEGLFWGFVSAFALACYTLIPGKVLEKWGSFIVTGLSMLVGGVVATVAVRPWTVGVEVSLDLALVMGAMVLVGTFAAYLFYLQGITDAGPVRAGLVGCVEPVSAAVISAVWLGTPVAPVDLVGIALIIGMMFLVAQRDGLPAKGAVAYDGSADDLPLFQGRASELGYYRARRAVRSDFARMKAVLEEGHRAVRALGIEEGRKRYPSARRLMRAIEAGCAYVVVADRPADGKEPADARFASGSERIIGVFALDPKGDPAYARACGARWTEPTEGDAAAYASLHWVTVAEEARRRGVGGFILGTAERIAREEGLSGIRADVYRDNAPVRALLEGGGYRCCGDIELRPGFGRVRRRAAYERTW